LKTFYKANTVNYPNLTVTNSRSFIHYHVSRCPHSFNLTSIGVSSTLYRRRMKTTSIIMCCIY